MYVGVRAERFELGAGAVGDDDVDARAWAYRGEVDRADLAVIGRDEEVAAISHEALAAAKSRAGT